MISIIACLRNLDRSLDPARNFCSRFAVPLLDLAIRLYMAQIFFSSGLLKFKNFLNGNWENTVFLFREIHPVPGFAPEITAVAGTAGEIILPVLLALGLCGRLAAAGLLLMTLTIEFAVPASHGISNPMHFMWMLLLAVPMFRGPGALSLDSLFLRWIRGAQDSRLAG